jgi:hypothetical protein
VTTDETRTLLARLLRGVAPDVDLDAVDPAAPLQEAAELDSMDFLNLVTALYDQTGIEVPERDGRRGREGDVRPRVAAGGPISLSGVGHPRRRADRRLGQGPPGPSSRR